MQHLNLRDDGHLSNMIPDAPKTRDGDMEETHHSGLMSVHVRM